MTSRRISLLVIFCVALGCAQATRAQAKPSPDKLLPADTGQARLHLMLKKLSTTARLMHTTAHPDDEDGGMLTFEARGTGTHTLLMTLTRGEGGQNKVGSSLSDSLGVLRTLELLASSRNYGVEQRFSRVADFGFSKSADETLQKWQGHDIALADVVRVIRTFRPDVIVARFSGTPRDGHGNHQASGIVTKEAFRAASDPKRFPEQLQEGLLPWQAKKFYLDKICWNDPAECEKDYTLKINSGTKDPDLGMSYIQFAMEGLRHQQSQGAASWSVEPGDRFSYFKLVDSVLPNTLDAAGREKSFFDGMDTTLVGLADRVGSEERDVPFLRDGLKEVQGKIEQAASDAKNAATPLLQALASLDALVALVEKADLSAAAKADLMERLREKQEECAHAANLALGVEIEATVAPPKGPGGPTPSESEALAAVSPGQALTVVVRVHNGSKQVLQATSVKLDVAEEWIVKGYRDSNRRVEPGADYYANFWLRVPASASFTRPYWHRKDPEREAVNTIDDARFATLPYAPPAVNAEASYELVHSTESYVPFVSTIRKHMKQEALGSRLVTPVVVPYREEAGQERARPLAIVPEFSVLVEPSSQVVPLPASGTLKVKVQVTGNSAVPVDGRLRIEAPESWRVEPEGLPVKFTHRGESQSFEFGLTPGVMKEGFLELHAALATKDREFREGYSLVTREDLGGFYYYQPAAQKLSVVEVKVPRDLKVGYIMGAGDEIPTVLQQLGIAVELIPAETVAKAELSRFSTIVLGIRAYDTQKDVIANNKRLLDYVSNGGTLVVQYNASTGDFNSGKFTPYPAQLSRARVSVEEAPVQMLAPADPVFHFPNEIAAKDFDGWVQERGLYFMSTWDGALTPLLACNDPGEEPQKGGMLKAKYGKGTYVYTGYAFFRQLPAGVPGAVRLYVNLLSAGHE